MQLVRYLNLLCRTLASNTWMTWATASIHQWILVFSLLFILSMLRILVIQGRLVSNPSFIFHPIFIVVFIFSYVLYKVLVYKNALYELPFSSDVVTHVFKNLICAWGSLYVRERGSNSFSSVLEKFHILHFACVTLFLPSVWMGAIVLIFKLGLMSCHRLLFQKRDL